LEVVLKLNRNYVLYHSFYLTSMYC